ncbi:MAG TPA: leucine-rich repeat protein, partial [Candidatus Borkfalkia avicola]|nr:leucine-rich repeat protein [Candidatus Borkfalkia avicola]
MPLVPAVCTQCGAPIEVDNAKEAGICPRCGTAFITEKVINNYITQHVSSTSVSQTIVKNIYGREKTEAEEYVARGLSFLGLGEYIKAAECFEKAVKSEPGNIENHILLYRALTLDFRLYYGGLTGPDCSCPISFRLSGQDEVSLDDVFGHIERLAKKADISALQKQYGHTFRADKAFWLESFRTAARLYDAQRNKRPDEILSLLQKNMSWPVKEFTLQAAYSVENLYACSDFTEEERAAFFEEYCGDYTDMRLRELRTEAKAKAEFFGRGEDCPDGPEGVLTVLTYKLFPFRDGYYDLTGYRGAVVYTDVWENDKTLPNLRLNAENITPGSLQNGDPLRAHGCRVAAEGTVNAEGRFLCCDTLAFEEGATEITGGSFAFCDAVFPDSLRRIGSRIFSLRLTPQPTVSVRFGSGLRRIESEAFYGQSEAGTTVRFSEPLVLPEGLEYLGERAFRNCAFEVILLPKSLQEAGRLPFGEYRYVRAVCLCDTSGWAPDWCVFPYFSDIDGKKHWCSYEFFDLPNNTYHLSSPPQAEKRARDLEILRNLFLAPVTNYTDLHFDENSVRFAAPYDPDNPPAKKGGCYIATAVYGSYDCPQVWTLRRYRDFSLSRTAPGRLFVKL